MSKKPAGRTARQRHNRMQRIANRDGGWFCRYCSTALSPIADTTRRLHPRSDPRSPTLDHVVPKSNGGPNDIDNLVLCCQECNQRKANSMTLGLAVT